MGVCGPDAFRAGRVPLKKLPLHIYSILEGPAYSLEMESLGAMFGHAEGERGHEQLMIIGERGMKKSRL